jgi:hypothetical protein
MNSFDNIISNVELSEYIFAVTVTYPQYEGQGQQQQQQINIFSIAPVDYLKEVKILENDININNNNNNNSKEMID